jgi:hypothetical protein
VVEKVTIERLALICYLYALATEQSSKPEPLNMIAILHLHDAVELFLILASEYLNAGKSGASLMEYWGTINQKLSNKDLAQKDAIKRLNEARNAFKHHGVIIASTEIKALQQNVTVFFDENTQKVFSIDFETISMSSLIQEITVRTRMEEADKLRGQNDIPAALTEVAIAFEELLYRFKGHLYEEKHIFPFEPNRFSHFRKSSFPNELSQFVSEVERSFKNINEQIKILSLGINYRDYIRFRWLVPSAHLTMSGKYTVVGTGRVTSHQDYAFCYNFLIENALRLQEFTL